MGEVGENYEISFGGEVPNYLLSKAQRTIENGTALLRAGHRGRANRLLIGFREFRRCLFLDER